MLQSWKSVDEMQVLEWKSERVSALYRTAADCGNEQRVELLRRARLVETPHSAGPPESGGGEDRVVEGDSGPVLVTTKLSSRQRMRMRVKERKRPSEEAQGPVEPPKRQRHLNHGEAAEWSFHEELRPILHEWHGKLMSGLEDGTLSLVEAGFASYELDAKDISELDWPAIAGGTVPVDGVGDLLSANGAIEAKALARRTWANTSDQFLVLDVADDEASRRLVFPPRCHFCVSDLADSAFSTFLSSSDRMFHVVLVDPPWPNRSAQRKQTYSLLPSTEVTAASLAAHLAQLSTATAEDAAIGIWCTNRAAHREAAKGVLEQLGFPHLSEWVWGKVAISGTWVVPLDAGVGNGRRPYEVMLLGRRSAANEPPAVQRRVVFAVPEREHSRKPREWNDLVARTLFPDRDSDELCCLELFARDLKPGSWSWGNQALRFQDEVWWLEGEVQNE
ncbi:MT-A70-domain-containing protein [Hyaloraphidium curvatum]|nr:MT-A70-domain-containing protein [Hyaloraphidium curvatum]